MVRFGFKNLRHEGSRGLSFSPLPETRRGKLLPLAFSLFFIFCLLNTNVLYAATATLSWEPPLTTSEVDYYKVYYGKASSTYGAPTPVGNTLSYTVTGLESGVTYYFTVTVVYKAGVESAYSNEGCYNSSASCTSGGGGTGSSGGGAEISGGGCGFVKGDGKGQGAKGEGLSFAIMLVIALSGIALIRKMAVQQT